MFDEDDLALKDVEIASMAAMQHSGNKFYPKKKKDPTDIPYVVISIFVDKDFPSEVKDKMFSYINKLMLRKVYIRINGDDKEFIARLNELKYDKLEIYIPFKGFNEIDTKFYFNDETCKMIAAKFAPSWEKIPKVVQSLLARNARMLFGTLNNSCSIALITWSPDGASRIMEIGKDTGRASHIIKMALSNYISVLNIQKENSEVVFRKTFRIDE